MPKLFIRIIAAFLIPCILLDSATAISLIPSTTELFSPSLSISNRMQEEALAGLSIWLHRDTSKGSLKDRSFTTSLLKEVAQPSHLTWPERRKGRLVAFIIGTISIIGHFVITAKLYDST